MIYENMIYENMLIGQINVQDGKRLLCARTLDKHTCSRCFFHIKSEKCPQGKKYPACFASERIDRTSVYYPLSRLL